MKILHTSDWHIGKQLKKIDFNKDINLFFDWLIELIQKESIDVLLMSGDLFDHANPSQQALHQYYHFLKRMIPLNCKIILTGGNHDAPSVLNAPKELLQILDITVIGGAPENIKDVFIEVATNDQKVIIAAVPYLRDRDLRKTIAGESYNDKITQTKAGLTTYFKQIYTYYSKYYASIPLITMAHLYVQGMKTSESEREIQIGNEAGIDAQIFGNQNTYVALGHIHRPQKATIETIRYSGSPIPLSFSEKNDQKQVIILELNNDQLDIKPIHVPNFRKLVTFKGTIEKVKEQLLQYKTNSPLQDLADILIIEENENIQHINDLEELLSTDNNYEIKIISGKIDFKNKIQGTASFLESGEDINDYTPMQLFKKRLEQDASINNTQELIGAFKEILDEIHQSQD